MDCDWSLWQTGRLNLESLWSQVCAGLAAFFRSRNKKERKQKTCSHQNQLFSWWGWARSLGRQADRSRRWTTSTERSARGKYLELSAFPAQERVLWYGASIIWRCRLPARFCLRTEAWPPCPDGIRERRDSPWA